MKIHAILFQIDVPSDKYIIAWLDGDGNGRWCQHAHPSKTLLDVEPGHVIVHKRSQYVVRRIKPYRTSECLDDSQYPWVNSGREFLATTEGGPSGG